MAPGFFSLESTPVVGAVPALPAAPPDAAGAFLSVLDGYLENAEPPAPPDDSEKAAPPDTNVQFCLTVFCPVKPPPAPLPPPAIDVEPAPVPDGTQAAEIPVAPESGPAAEVEPPAAAASVPFSEQPVAPPAASLAAPPVAPPAASLAAPPVAPPAAPASPDRAAPYTAPEHPAAPVPTGKRAFQPWSANRGSTIADEQPRRDLPPIVDPAKNTASETASEWGDTKNFDAPEEERQPAPDAPAMPPPANAAPPLPAPAPAPIAPAPVPVPNQQRQPDPEQSGRPALRPPQPDGGAVRVERPAPAAPIAFAVRIEERPAVSGESAPPAPNEVPVHARALPGAPAGYGGAAEPETSGRQEAPARPEYPAKPVEPAAVREVAVSAAAAASPHSERLSKEPLQSGRPEAVPANVPEPIRLAGDGGAPAPSAEIGTPAEIGPEPEMPARPATPVRGLTLRLEGQRDDIGIRLAERGGEIRVAVHAPEGELSRQLQDHLPELVRGLDRQGYSAETWRPAETSSRSDTGDRGAQDAPAGGGQGGAHQDGRGRRRPPQPDWLEQLGRSEAESERNPTWQSTV